MTFCINRMFGIISHLHSGFRIRNSSSRCGPKALPNKIYGEKRNRKRYRTESNETKTKIKMNQSQWERKIKIKTEMSKWITERDFQDFARNIIQWIEKHIRIGKSAIEWLFSCQAKSINCLLLSKWHGRASNKKIQRKDNPLLFRLWWSWLSSVLVTVLVSIKLDGFLNDHPSPNWH